MRRVTKTSRNDAPAALTDDLGLMICRLGAVTRLRMAESLAPVGLTMRQFAVLRALSANEGMSQAALGESLQIDASSMVLVLDECQNSGWTQRRPSPTDRRRYALHLTPAGRRVLDRAQKAAAAAEAELFAPLEPGQQAQLQELLIVLLGSGRMVSSPSGPPAAAAAS